mgnify:CR=1 FL=1
MADDQDICEILTHVFEENASDPVSLVTVIDVYATQVQSTGTFEEKEAYLKKLLELMMLNNETVAEIGWDLPKILLQFVAADNIGFDKKLSQNGVISTLMKCFNKIALSGNAKECLLTACELLSDLKIGEVTPEDLDQGTDDIYTPVNVNEFIPDLKLHILIQLMIGCVQRVQTLYPSKFLGLIVKAIAQCSRSNIDTMHDTKFLLKRVYEFCVNYSKFQENRQIPSDESGDASTEELEKIASDEKALECKLITHLFTHILSLGLKHVEPYFDLNYFSDVAKLAGGKSTDDVMDPELKDICSKYYLLAILYDVDIEHELNEYLEESQSIYDTAMEKVKQADKDDDKEKLNQFIYKLSYAFSVQKTFSEKTLKVDPFGAVILSAIFYVEEGKHALSQVSITQALYLYVRCASASLYSDLYHSKAMESAARYWLWMAITQNSTNDLKHELGRIPSLITAVFLQLLLLKNCTQADTQVKGISFTLLSRVLCLIPEDIAFDFILDTLLMCPYISARCHILSILKTMMLKPMQAASETLTEQVQKLDIDATAASPPQLPPRPYIGINEHRMAAIHSLALMTLEECKKDTMNKAMSTLLLSYLNFFASLRAKWDAGLLTTFHSKVAEVYNDTTEETIPETGFIKLANDTLV